MISWAAAGAASMASCWNEVADAAALSVLSVAASKSIGLAKVMLARAPRMRAAILEFMLAVK